MNEPKLILVYANPYTHVDHMGRPNGHLQYEPDLVNGDPHLRWVGCRVVATQTRKPEPLKGVREAHDHSWEYASDPTVLPQSAYYQRALQHHDLLPADLETWEYAFGSKEGYIDARARLGQLAAERDAIPTLARTQAVLDAEAAAKAAGQEFDATQAEWDAFVGEAHAAHKAKAQATLDANAKAIADKAKSAPAKGATPKTSAAPAKSEG